MIPLATVRRRAAGLAAVALAMLAAAFAPATAQAPAQPPPQPPAGGAGPLLAPIPKRCETPGATAAIPDSQLPRVATALKERKNIRILAIGGPSVSLGGRSESGPFGLVEKFLEANFKGLDVEIIDRGVSGELARDAAERMKTEVALSDADLVLWQLGTADAMAGVDAEDLRKVIAEAVTWLKEHNVDVILIGQRYAAQLAGDPQYQAIRRTIREIAAELGVMRLSRYEAEETLARIRSETGQELSETEASDAAYVCMAEYLARSIASGLFVRAPLQRPGPGSPTGQGPETAPAPAATPPEPPTRP